MERFNKPPQPDDDPLSACSTNEVGRVDWTSGRARSDIAADLDIWLLAAGFVDDVPIVTADSFRTYVENWMMGPGTVTEADGALIHDSYTERFIFPVVGMIGSEPVYAIKGYGTFERSP